MFAAALLTVALLTVALLPDPGSLDALQGTWLAASGVRLTIDGVSATVVTTDGSSFAGKVSLTGRRLRIVEDDGSVHDEEPPATRPLRILLAEDSLVNQKLAMGLLERHGHEVTVTNNGLEAIAALGRGRFDMVLMDVQMPE